jgi:hypothetical protein
MKLIDWIKTHKALTLLILIVAYFGWTYVKSFFGVNLRGYSIPTTPQVGYGSSGTFGGLTAPAVSLPELSTTDTSLNKTSDVSTSTERMVVQNSNLSLLVKDVRDTGNKILKWVDDSGGYMVSTSYNRPSESPFATITVRVPADRFNDSLDYFRSLALKVTNENLIGKDITEQYEDTQAKLNTLETTKAKFMEILTRADKVADILQVQREIINLQTQIDALKGRQDAMKKEVDMAKVTLYLSTDELSLPYTPDTKLRPNVVFKLAVRSLLNTLRMVTEALIWVGVYSAIWLPVVVVYFIIKRMRKSKATKV